MENGLGKKARAEITEELKNFLADSYALYLKTQNFHWNVTGPEFFSLHKLFETHYEDLAEGIDELAERIRSLDVYVEGSFSAFKRRSKIPEVQQLAPAKKMLEELSEGHDWMGRSGRSLITLSQELHDEVTADLIIKRMAFHEKAAWMLRSHL